VTGEGSDVNGHRPYALRETEGHELPEAAEGADPWSAVLAGQEVVPAYLTSLVGCAVPSDSLARF
jgi:hypothetical protein